MITRIILVATALGLWVFPLRAQEADTNKPSGEAPSAELIIDAEETVVKEPALAPGEQPLPPMDGSLPGEQNIFGQDLFGGPGMFVAPETPSEPQIPERPPLLEDPKEAERKIRVQFRKVKAVVDQDRQVLELQDMARRAPTPEDERAARRAYYTVFFQKIRKADTNLTAYADKLEAASLAPLYQTRIQPTEPLNPPPQPQPAAKFIPPPQFPEVEPLDERPVALP